MPKGRYDPASHARNETREERDVHAEHQLQAVNSSLWMCRCGQAFFGCQDAHHARQRLAQHIQCVKEVHEQIRQEQSYGDPFPDHHT